MCAAHEPGDPRSVTHGTPTVIGVVHADQDVPGELVALDRLLLALLDLGDLFGRDLDLEDVVLHVEGVDPGLQVGLHTLLETGVRVHHVPQTRQAHLLLAEGLDGVHFLLGGGLHDLAGLRIHDHLGGGLHDLAGLRIHDHVGGKVLRVLGDGRSSVRILNDLRLVDVDAAVVGHRVHLVTNHRAVDLLGGDGLIDRHGPVGLTDGLGLGGHHGPVRGPLDIDLLDDRGAVGHLDSVEGLGARRVGSRRLLALLLVGGPLVRGLHRHILALLTRRRWRTRLAPWPDRTGRSTLP